MDAPTVARPHAGLVHWLREHGVEYQVHEHAETFTATSTAESERVDPRTFAKVVGVRTNDGRDALIVVDACDRVDLHKARAALGAKDVTLLDESELAALAPDCEPGAVPAVGHLFRLPMLADDTVGDDREISFNAGTHRHSVRVDTKAWAEATRVRYADLAVDGTVEPARAQS